MSASKQFPPLRACIFDMDGLLLNTEALYSTSMNNLLARYNHPPIPSALKPRFMGVSATSVADLLYSWANLPISREQFEDEQNESKGDLYQNCELLPGVKELLRDLKSAKTSMGEKMKIALASSTTSTMFKVKTSGREISKLFGEVFEERLRVLGDNTGLKKGRGKPAPDIFLLALKAINETLSEGEKDIVPAECLVFEDSVPGVEAGRRAGMRVIWVPQEDLAIYYEGKEEIVLAGRSGLEDIGDEEQLGEAGDGWGEMMASLEGFPHQKFGLAIAKS